MAKTYQDGIQAYKTWQKEKAKATLETYKKACRTFQKDRREFARFGMKLWDKLQNIEGG